MNNVLKTAKLLVPEVRFNPSNSFSWTPKTNTVTYSEKGIRTEAGVWSFLHELGHAKLAHVSYESDFELLKLEVDAWRAAQSLASKIDVQIDADHIQDCLDTYRDWLHQRSTCPTCGSIGLQHSPDLYRCHNCNGEWRVTQSRFCRAYRRKILGTTKKSPQLRSETTFR